MQSCREIFMVALILWEDSLVCLQAITETQTMWVGSSLRGNKCVSLFVASGFELRAKESGSSHLT